MDWITQLTSNPLVQQVAGSYLTKPQPVPKVIAPAPTAAPVVVNAPAESMSKSTMMMIGGGILAVVLMVVMVARNK